MIEVEVVICTWNRADSLRRTLESLCRVVVPDSVHMTAMIVDNGSTDRTAEVLLSFGSGVLPLRVITEPQQGLSHARNAAIEVASGDLVIWTDDDVLFSPTWLVNYTSAFSQQPSVSFWGGPIVPLLPADTPAWVTDNYDTLKGCFAARDLGPTSVPFSKSVLPYGANFAVRTSVQQRFKFDVSLGRQGDSLDGGEETELLFRLLQSGHRGRWVPEALVEHAVAADRLTEGWLRSYFEGQGRTLARSGEAWSRSAWWLRTLAGYHNWRYQSLRSKSNANSAAWLGHLVRASLAKGQIRK